MLVARAARMACRLARRESATAPSSTSGRAPRGGPRPVARPRALPQNGSRCATAGFSPSTLRACAAPAASRRVQTIGQALEMCRRDEELVHRRALAHQGRASAGGTAPPSSASPRSAWPSSCSRDRSTGRGGRRHCRGSCDLLSLARLRQQQGFGREAHDVIAAVYGRFTEGLCDGRSAGREGADRRVVGGDRLTGGNAHRYHRAIGGARFRSHPVARIERRRRSDP